MAAPVDLFCVDSFPSHLSPLDGLLPRSHLDSVIWNNTDPPTLFFSPQRPHGPGVLMRVHSTPEDDTEGCGGTEFGPGSRLRLGVSDFFLRHHGLQRLGSTGTVRALEPVQLDRVVLGARNPKSLRWAGTERFTAGLMELCRPGHWLMVRQGDPLRLPEHPLLGEDPGQVQQLFSDIVVLDCSPVVQGQITPDTSVVLTDCTDWSEPPGFTPRRPASLSVSDFALYADSLGGHSLLENRKLLDSGMWGVLQALECRVEVCVGDPQTWVRSQWDGALDVDSCMFVEKQLLLRLGLFNHEWVKLSRAGGDGERLVSVVAMDPVPQNHIDMGLISATLWFNLTDGDVIPLSSCSFRMKRWRSPQDLTICRSDSSCRSSSPPFASELHLQPIISPLNNNLGCYDSLLSQHFNTARLVSVGDVLSVPIQNHPDLLETSSDGIHRCPVFSFKVQKVCLPVAAGGGGAAAAAAAHQADRQHTSLYLGPPTNSPTPCLLVGGDTIWSSLNPPGLGKTVETICSIISPHLNHRCLSSCTILLHGPAGSGKGTVVGAASRRLHLHLLKVDSVSLCADTPAASESKLLSVFHRAEVLQPCILLLHNLHVLLPPQGGAGEDSRIHAALCQMLHSASSRVVVVATVHRPQDLSAGAMAAFIHQVELGTPTEEQRQAMLMSLSRGIHLGRDVDMGRVAKLTAGLVLGSLCALVSEAGRASCRRLVEICAGRTEKDLCTSGVTVRNQDFLSALQTLQGVQSKAVGAPKIPDVQWEDVGGLHEVKKEILDTVQLPLQRPELLSMGLNRTGVLLYGPPGTGKTLLAKAVATECAMTFLSVKGPELINMYVGQSEENVREVFNRARSAAPCVIFFDELDSLAPSRGRSGDSGGVMDRVVSQLLAELDALHSTSSVFVIGATNRPDLLDQSLLRPGRFDKLIYVGINEDRDSQLQVLQAIVRKFHLDSAVNLQEVLELCPCHMTGADLYALCSDAMTAAIKRKIALIDQCLDSEDTQLLVLMDDFATALENFHPSVSEQELIRYQNIQQKLSTA